MKIEELTTKRMALRKLTPTIFKYIYEQLTIPEQMAFLGLNSKEEWELEKNKYNDGLWTHNKKFLYFQLLEKTSRNIIGWCGYHTWYTDHYRAEIGYGLFTETHKKKGLMSEAMAPILQYGFTVMKLNRIEAFIGPDNIASIKLARKFKFEKEGLLREHYYVNGRAEDSVLYALLKSGYKQ